MAKKKSSQLLTLTAQEELLRHNLETRSYWSQRDPAPVDGVFSHAKEKSIPRVWHMTKGITLYDWQEDCVNKWFENKRGTIKVVTGAGKTILALAIMEKLQAVNKDLRVAIVVPTTVLQDQWYDEILRNSNLPPEMIGRLSGDYKDKFDGKTRILICVLNSAAKRLPRLAAKSKVEENLLLIADECHKAGASFMQRVFLTKRAYNLGLSATPEREEELETNRNEDYCTTILGQELGPIIYELTVRQALEQGILPEFEIHHYGLPLSEIEREQYENLSRRLRDVAGRLRELGHQQGIHESNITNRTQQLAKRDDELGQAARQHLFLTNQRKHLLYNSTARQAAVINIIHREFQQDPATKALVFHESIESVMLLYHRLLEAEFPVAVEHSALPETVRKTSIELFREGTAQIIVSARSLIEGFNVPETDIGIIAASSASVRQRIQTIGRLLRKGKDPDKVARIYTLYMANTTDEVIYGKSDWDSLLGAQRNRYFLLDEKGNLKERQEPPRTPLPRDSDIPMESLKAGDEYPGVYEGTEYSCDSDGNVLTADGDLVINPQGVPELIRKVRGSYGRFKVTPKQRYLLFLETAQGEWVVKFVGVLKEPFRLAELESESDLKEIEVSGFELGRQFPPELVGKNPQAIYLRQSRGRTVLAKKEGRGWLFVRTGRKAEDPTKGLDGANLLQAAVEYKKSYPGLSKMLVTNQGHVVVLKDGKYRYICTLKTGLEFP